MSKTHDAFYTIKISKTNRDAIDKFVTECPFPVSRNGIANTAIEVGLPFLAAAAKVKKARIKS